MSQLTAARFATLGTSTGGAGATPVAWTNPGNVVSDNAANASVTVSGTTSDSQVLGGEKFALLSEDGGPIPVGATIIRITASIELLHTVTDALVANTSSRTWRMRRGTAGAAINEQTVAQNDNTNSGLIIVTATTGGTTAVPQTTFTRAELLNAEATNQLRLEVTAAHPAAALNSATLDVDFMRVVVEWIKYEDRAGSAFTSGIATAILKETVLQVGNVADGSAFGSGVLTASEFKVGDVADGAAFGSGVAQPLVTMAGATGTTVFGSGQQLSLLKGTASAPTSVFAAGILTSQVTAPGTGTSLAFAAGSTTAAVNATGVGVSSAFASGIQKWALTLFGTARADALASGIQLPLFSGAGTTRADAFASGVALPQITQSGTALALALVNGAATAAANVAGTSTALAFVAGIQKSLVTPPGAARADAFASGTWQLTATAGGSARADAFAFGAPLAQVIQNGIGLALALATGDVKTQFTNAGDVAAALAFASGTPSPLVLGAGSVFAQSVAAGILSPIITVIGATAPANASSSGVARAYSFAISGYSRDSDGVLLGGVRVDIYRKSDHVHMGRVTSHAVSAYYSLAIPNTVEVFWCRFYLVGPPDRFDTTIDNLALVESQTQGPPP